MEAMRELREGKKSVIDYLSLFKVVSKLEISKNLEMQLD
jgi:hypothetical protein